MKNRILLQPFRITDPDPTFEENRDPDPKNRLQAVFRLFWKTGSGYEPSEENLSRKPRIQIRIRIRIRNPDQKIWKFE